MTIGMSHGMSCGCFAKAVLSRRSLFGIGAGGLAYMAAPGAFAAGDYEFMLLSCIDPRLVSEVHGYFDARKLRGEYSQVVLAGGPVAAVAPAFKKWHVAVWDNLDTTIKLHNVKRAFGMTHRDCSAVKIAYGTEAVATPDIESATHGRILREFRAQVAKRHPKLGCETGIMSLNGSVEMIGG